MLSFDGVSKTSAMTSFFDDSKIGGLDSPQQSGGVLGGDYSPRDTGSKAMTNLIVNYLPQNMSQEEIKSLFSSMGEVESCKLVRDKLTGQSLGYGFVNYVRAEDASKAANTLNGLRLQNKTIKVSFARPSNEAIKGANLYVSGLPKTMTQPELEKLFTPFGEIVTSRILSDSVTGLSKGVGFVRYDRRQEAEAAIQRLNGTMLVGSCDPITVKFANSVTANSQKTGSAAAAAAMLQQLPAAALLSNPLALLTASAAATRRLPGGPIHHSIAGRSLRYSPLASAEQLLTQQLLAATAVGNQVTSPVTSSLTGPGAAAAAASGFTLFVYNLAPETEDAVLWQLFGPFGAVLSVKIIRDFQTNKCKGFGFVTMANYEDALTAITHLHGTTLGSRVLQVSFKTASQRMLR